MIPNSGDIFLIIQALKTELAIYQGQLKQVKNTKDYNPEHKKKILEGTPYLIKKYEER